MKKSLFILFFTLICFTSVLAQKGDSLYNCATPDFTRNQMEKLPWYGNNQFLYDFLEDLEGSKNERTERDFEGY